LAAVSLHEAYAQLDSTWSKVDTLTSGPFEDTHPELPHNADAYVSRETPIRVVFERHTQVESQIAAVSFRTGGAGWDSVVQVISSAPLPEQQIHPDYAEVIGSRETIGMAVWQRMQSGKWQIYYSVIRDSQTTWSSPVLLVADTVDNFAVCVRPFPRYGYDSTFLVTWKRGGSLRALLWSPSGISLLDTIAFAGPDVVEYDMATFWDQVHLVWTAGANDSTVVQYQRLVTSPTLSVATQETLLTGVPVSNPHTAVSNYGVPILLESPTTGGSDIIVILAFSFSPSEYNLSNDPTAENRNPSAFSFPFITKAAKATSSGSVPFFNACVYEKYRGTDSMLVFLSGGWSDTLRSTGHNVNAEIGSRGLFGSAYYLPIVWESNRTGRSHIYGRWARVDYGDDVAEELSFPTSFRLDQNYPNPFNPKTGIRYQVPGVSDVKITVYDMLGKEVAVLVNERKLPGQYEVVFDGSHFASGVYFYRLQAGDFTQTKRLLLLK
jgi:hypothetical protein